ncbi:MAG TPA: cytochrome c oxidase subunit 3 [Opitutaceae bacterium]|jgi:cytochrome c oxidase subunit 3|nr:cytochrome c oxidase subunit 3 [Opitutaceae bacterium]
MSPALAERAAAEAEERAVTNRLGMWAFLATEVMFFGGMFLAYGIYRSAYPAAFAAGGRVMELGWGTANTAVLLVSSFFMALGDRAARAGDRRALRHCLVLVALLGLAFLAIKGHEYAAKIDEGLIPGRSFRHPGPPQLPLFMTLYFAMTGLHALHMIFGVSAIAWLLWRNSPRRGRPVPVEPVAIVGLYWHFVDCIWIFLYPLFYLAGR